MRNLQPSKCTLPEFKSLNIYSGGLSILYDVHMFASECMYAFIICTFAHACEHDIYTLTNGHAHGLTYSHTVTCARSKMNSLILAALLLCGATVALASEHCSYEDADIVIKEWNHIFATGNSAPVLLHLSDIIANGYEC